MASRGGLIALSVVFVKQHYVADVVAGLANGTLCYLLTVKLEPRWRRWLSRGKK